MTVNMYKIRKVLQAVQARSELPEDDYGNVWQADDLIGWFELEDILTSNELKIVKHELELMAEAQFILGFS